MCKVYQTTSKCRTVSCGVPQGSNLGIIMFLLLPNCLKSTTASMFADDATPTTSGNTSPELYNKLNDDLDGDLNHKRI